MLLQHRCKETVVTYHLANRDHGTRLGSASRTRTLR